MPAASLDSRLFAPADSLGLRHLCAYGFFMFAAFCARGLFRLIVGAPPASHALFSPEPARAHARVRPTMPEPDQS